MRFAAGRAPRPLRQLPQRIDQSITSPYADTVVSFALTGTWTGLPLSVRSSRGGFWMAAVEFVGLGSGR